jgi:hypothetical protein
VFRGSFMPDRTRTELTITCTPKGPDKCVRVIDALIEARMFGIGAMMEKQSEKWLRDAWQKSAEATNAALATGAGG